MKDSGDLQCGVAQFCLWKGGPFPYVMQVLELLQESENHGFRIVYMCVFDTQRQGSSVSVNIGFLHVKGTCVSKR